MKHGGQIARVIALGVFFIGFGLIWSWLKRQQMDLSYEAAELRKTIGDNEKRREDLETQYELETARENLERRRERSETQLREIRPDQIIFLDPDGNLVDSSQTTPEP